VSVVIATINESAHVASAIRSAWQGGAAEVIVSDGGSTDETIAIAVAEQAQVIESPCGRGSQMNRGAQAATGDIVQFLHADNRLPVDFATQIRQAVTTLAAKLGAYWQSIENRRFPYRLLESGNRWRIKFYNLAYGDQGIWIFKDLFWELGGFPEVPLMEDYLFSQRLPPGVKYTVLRGPLYISARRWESIGPMRQTLKNWKIISRYRRGASLDELAQMYGRHDGLPRQD
jgi:rSAM/selenodomain-associated transferase 2